MTLNYNNMIRTIATAMYRADKRKWEFEYYEPAYTKSAEAAFKAMQGQMEEFNMMADGTKKPALAYHYLKTLRGEEDD